MATCADCGLPILRPEQTDLCDACQDLRSSERSLRVRPLDYSDLELVMAWRSHPEIYRHFRQQEGPLEWSKHVDWFESRNHSRHDYVIEYGGRRVGVVSLGKEDDVGIFLGDFSARGEGVATAALRWLCDRFQNRSPLHAEIHEDNEASKRLFSHCGFEHEGDEGEWLRYEYEP